MYFLILALILAPQASPPPARPLQARFIGQMAFSITDGTVTLVSDFPYQVGYAGAPSFEDGELHRSTLPTVALITHRHLDHWDPVLFSKTNWKVIAPADAMERIRSDRVVPLSKRIEFGPIVIEPIETPHARIGHYSYIVSWQGKRLYFSGDTESPDSLLAAQRLDLAFVSSWQFQSAQRRGGRIDAKRVVIYHHQPGEQVPGCAGNCVVPGQNDAFEIR